MAHNFESGFFVNKAAWHGLGRILDNPPNTSQAIVEAQLNWTVEEKPLFSQIDDNFQLIPTHKSLVRSTDMQLLGVVSKHYSPLQNQDAFNWFDFLLHDGDVSLEAAGSLKEGKRVWILAKINQDAAEIVKDDAVEPYLLLSNSHDGSTAIWIQFTPIRVVCQNTLSWALSKRNQDLKQARAFQIRHQGNIQSKLQGAQVALDFARQKFTTTIDEYRAMANCAITQNELDIYLSLVLNNDTPQSTRAYPHAEWADFIVVAITKAHDQTEYYYSIASVSTPKIVDQVAESEICLAAEAKNINTDEVF